VNSVRLASAALSRPRGARSPNRAKTADRARSRHKGCRTLEIGNACHLSHSHNQHGCARSSASLRAASSTVLKPREGRGG
jgi:hypothetical protein